MVTTGAMDSESAVKTTVRQFLLTTTLHGFKYLYSEFNIDRVGWMISCVASACCAGVLCAVLWARFLEVPALLQVRDMLPNVTLAQFMPQVSVYPPTHSLAGFFQQLNMNESMINRLTRTVHKILVGRSAAEDQLNILEQVLSAHNTTLTEMMFKYSPTCEDLILNCRWQRIEVPCGALFEKVLMTGGVYCIMRPDKVYHRLFNASHRPIVGRYQQTITLDLSLQCSNETKHACKFFAKYNDELKEQAMVLAPGYIYIAQMLFDSVPMSSAEGVLELNCVNGNTYSRDICVIKCAEIYCGCTDPLRDIEVEEETYLHPCSVTQLGCLRAFIDQANVTCECLPSCNQMTSDISLESTKMNLDTFTIDPIYEGLNSKSTVIHLTLNLALSKIYTLNPTETWLTLLSSLGGVFNMFLGVGLFSALEMLFFLLFKFPYALLNPRTNLFY